MAELRSNIPTKQELIDLIIADIALSIAFSIVFGTGNFLLFFPIALFAVSISFILHEYMHKIVAQRFGAIAAFKRSDFGIIIALVTSFLGFLLAMPGATMIYTNNFTKKENGLTSLVGPLTNLIIFLIVISIALTVRFSSYIETALVFAAFINLWLAFFNMLPIYPLDGSKVLAWSKPLYIVVLLVAMIFLVLIGPLIGLTILGMIFDIGFLLVIAFIMSYLYRGILFRTF
ncbi:MAG: site-2 protease family protein [Candidatus Micrarchaeia archaeon]